MGLGYACINLTLAKNNPKITTNRSMVKKTFLNKGVIYAGELALQNVKDIIKILEWNLKNNIFFFRISSDIFPWASHYNISNLPQYNDIKDKLLEAGNFAKKNNIRITAHPGPFNVLVSPNENVIKNTFIDLKMHGELFDMMKLEKSVYNKINIHG